MSTTPSRRRPTLCIGLAATLVGGVVVLLPTTASAGGDGGGGGDRRAGRADARRFAGLLGEEGHPRQAQKGGQAQAGGKAETPPDGDAAGEPSVGGQPAAAGVARHHALRLATAWMCGIPAVVNHPGERL